MKIKDFKIVEEKTYNNTVNYIKFKRLFFGIIPIWIYLRNSHYEKDYKYDRYSFNVLVFNIIAIFLNIVIEKYQVFFNVFYFLSLIYMIYALVWLYSSYNGRITLSNYHGDDKHLIQDAQYKIDDFNDMFDKTKNNTRIVYTSETEKNKNYYQINIPRINFKKYLY